MSKTLVKLIALAMGFIALAGCEKIKKEKDSSDGKILEFAINEIEYKNVSFNVVIKKASNPENYTVGVLLSRYGDPLDQEQSNLRMASKSMNEADENGQLTFNFYSLIAGETYNARAYISTPEGKRTYTDDMLTFVTDPAKVPVCAFFAVTPTSETRARYESRWDNRGFTISEYGIEYSTSQSELEKTGGNKTKVTGSGGSITGLTPSKTYYARAYAKNAEGIGYSPVISLTMPAEPDMQCVVFDVFPSSTAIYAQYEWEGKDIAEKGLIYSTSESSPTLSTGTKYPEACAVTELKSGYTQHFVRSYATNKAGQTVYSGTKTVNPSLAVNMGLSVKWASVNVGTSSVVGYGDYFMWGLTSLKSNFTWEKYDYYSSGQITKYKPGDSNRSLANSDDAAYAKMGEGWHTPTADEWNELIKDCEFTLITLDKTTGCKVKSKKTGNCIFLPAGGSYSDSGNSTKGIQCAYWTADVNASGTIYMYAKFFSYHKEYNTPNVSDYGYRYGGRSVRAVNR